MGASAFHVQSFGAHGRRDGGDVGFCAARTTHGNSWPNTIEGGLA